MPSAFHWAVIRYAKPFLNSKSESGKVRYPIKHIKHSDGFSCSMHSHLIEVRSALVAHDDFTEIPPRILKFGMKLGNEGDECFVPTSIVASNKCISFPSDPETVKRMLQHSKVACLAIHEKLIMDLTILRRLTLEYPEMAKEDVLYTKNYGQERIDAKQAHMNPPDFTNDSWLNAPVPDYSDLHNGYQYEEARINKDFHGPEKITLPDGSYFEITPNKGG